MFNENDHPRDNDGKFAKKNGDVNESSEKAKSIEAAVKEYSGLSAELTKQKILNEQKSVVKKITPAEKIASVHIDFNRDNILPELNESELKKIGVKKNKPILLKKSVIERNREEHGDLTDSDFERIVANALYSPSEVFSANREKPYFHFAKVIEINSKGKPEIGLALLDVDDGKDNFEIVHAHFIGSKALKRAKKKD